MTGTMYFEPIMMEVEAGKPCDLTELVRGCDRRLIDEMTPLVRRQSVSLDLRSVERIDAAGIAALIWLYRIAHESGHGFSVSNASPRVRELLTLVGLDRLILSHDAGRASHSGPLPAQNAA